MKIKNYNYFLDGDLVFGEKRFIRKDKVESKGTKLQESLTKNPAYEAGIVFINHINDLMGKKDAKAEEIICKENPKIDSLLKFVGDLESQNAAFEGAEKKGEIPSDGDLNHITKVTHDKENGILTLCYDIPGNPDYTDLNIEIIKGAPDNLYEAIFWKELQAEALQKAQEGKGEVTKEGATARKDPAIDAAKPLKKKKIEAGVAPGGQEVKQDAPPKGQEVADVKPTTGEKPAEKEQKPSEKAKLPPGEGADLYDFVYNTAVGLNTSINSPFVQVMLQGCAWMAQHGGFLFDMFSPDRFMKSLDGEKLANEQFTDKQKRLLKEQRLREIPTEFKLNDYKDLNGIEASTKYVSSLLFPGEKDEEITDPKILGARLLHWAVDEKKFYKQDTLTELNKEGRDIPKGTVIFFTEGINGQLFTAYATGHRKEFIYFKPNLTEPQKFQLNDKDHSPVKNEMDLKAAFIPSYNTDQGYFAAHPLELSQDAYGPTLAAIAKLKPKISETKEFEEASLRLDPNFKNLDTARMIGSGLSEIENDVKIAVEALKELTEAQHPDANIKKTFLIEQISIYRGVIKDFRDKYSPFVTAMKAREVEKETKEKELATLTKDDPKRKGLETAIKDLETKLKPYLEAQKESPSPDKILASLDTLGKNADNTLATLNPNNEVKVSSAATAGAEAGLKPDETKSDQKPAETKSDQKPAETKSDQKPAETKSDVKPAETKSDVKPAETKSDVKPAETKSD